ncbi:MAG: DUF2164 domain-containing protein [Gammaproteobacteria bacterium]|jgi:uncharacterized protein (DUF2164 family)
MSQIEFSKEEKALLVRKLQMWFSEELGQTLGRFDAEFLLDFVGKEFGAYFYNRGLYDAQAILARRVDDLRDAMLELERPTEFGR